METSFFDANESAGQNLEHNPLWNRPIGPVARFRAPRGADINHENLQWLLSLPPKARKFHFSLKEQASLTESSEPFGRSAHGLSLQRDFSSQGSRPPFRSFSTMPPWPFNPQLPPMQYHANPTALQDIDETLVMQCEPSPNSSLDNGRDVPVAETPAASLLVRRRRPSIRKAISLMANPHLQSTSTSSPPSPVTVAKQKKHKQDPEYIDHEEIGLAQSEYYQDPQTRLKLKRLLSSPQNFEEALEFGFPSAPKADERIETAKQPLRTSLSSPTANNDAQRFLRENSLSFIDADDDLSKLYNLSEEGEDYDEDDEFFDAMSLESNDCNGSKNDQDSLSDFDSPKTPQAADMRSLSYSRMNLPFTQKAAPGVNGQTLSPKVMRYFHDGDPESLLRSGPWEKTLRITLTKPELRASEQEIYGDAQTRRPSDITSEGMAQTQDQGDLLHGNYEVGRVRNLWNRVKQWA